MTKSHLLHNTINSPQNMGLVLFLCFSSISWPVSLVLLVFLRFLSQMYFSLDITAYSICNQSVLVDIHRYKWVYDINEFMLFRVFFFFPQLLLKKSKSFSINPTAPLSKKLFQVKSFAKVVSKGPPGSFSCSQCAGCLPHPNPASFPNPMQIKLRLRTWREPFNYDPKNTRLKRCGFCVHFSIRVYF